MPGHHFYTVDPAGELAPRSGYQPEGTACYVFGTQVEGTQPLFRWFHPGSGDHFYTLDPGGELASQSGYESEGVHCYVFPERKENSVPLFRWFNPGNGDHFYTTDPTGELAPASGYSSEGIACHVLPSQQPGAIALLRWFVPSSPDQPSVPPTPGHHFYTVDPAGELAPRSGYQPEGTACYVFGTQVEGTQPLFRWFHPVSRDHFYTLDPGGELASQSGYQSEGVQCYVFPAAKENSVPLFRWFNPGNGDHFYTTDPTGELAPTSGYSSEGTACHVLPSQQPGAVALFRWFVPSSPEQPSVPPTPDTRPTTGGPPLRQPTLRRVNSFPPGDRVQALSPKTRERMLRVLRPRPAALTHLESWTGLDLPDTHNPFGAIVAGASTSGPVAIDWERTYEMDRWTFRWSTKQRGAVSAVIQMARYPFAQITQAWDKPAGLVLTKATKVPGEVIAVDLRLIAPRPPWWPERLQAIQGLLPMQAVAGVVPTPSSGGRLHLPDTIRTISGATATPHVGTAASRESAIPHAVAAVTALPKGPVLPLSYSLYARIITLDAAGKPVGLPSNTVELQFVQIAKQPPIQFPPAPSIKIIGFRPAQAYWFDWQCHVIANKDQPHPFGGFIWRKGEHLDACAKSDDAWYEDVANAIGGAFSSAWELLKDGANWLSETYSSLKSTAINFAASLAGCSENDTRSECGVLKTALATGLDIALTSVGMPPSLPDFDQLESMGTDYVAQVLVEESGAANVPLSQEMAKQMVKKIIDEGKAALDQSHSSGGALWHPNPDCMYKPLLLTLEARNTRNDPSPPYSMRVAQVDLKKSLEVTWQFKPQSVHIPPLFPGQAVKLSVALTPIDDPADWMSLMPTDKDVGVFDIAKWIKMSQEAKQALDVWTTVYTGGIFRFTAQIKDGFSNSFAFATCYPDGHFE